MNIIEEVFPIKEITVYPEQAMIKRIKKLRFAHGKNKVLIKKVPASLSADSVRVETGNPSLLSILDVSVEDSYIETYDENRYRAAKSSIDAMSAELKKLEADYHNFNEEFFLFMNKESLVETIKRDNTRSINVRNWDDFFSFMRTHLTSNRKKARETVFEWFELRKKIEAARANLSGLSSYDTILEHAIAVVIDASGDTDEDVIISYMSQSVSWYPAYTIRADLAKNEIQVALHALVTQSTGEDWSSVALKLSTAVPLSDCSVPELASLRIRERSAEIERAEPEPASEIAYDSDIDGLFGGDERNKDKADVLVEEKKAAGMGKGRARSPKKAKPKAVPSVSAKSVSTGYIEGTAGTSLGGISGKPSDLPAMEQEVSVPGGIENLGMLANEAQARLAVLIPLDRISEHFGEYGELIRDRFVPEDIIPGSGAARVNPAFESGVSPLASMGGFDYRYDVPGIIDSIPSGESPVQVGVDIATFSLELCHVAVPIENDAVYLKASFKNTYQNPFPRGPAQVFSGNNFLCNIMFPTLGLGEQASVSMGIDRDIKVVRKEEIKRKTGGFVKKEIVSECSVAIELVSYKDTDVDVKVYDRIPMSEKPREVEIFAKKFSQEPLYVTKRSIAVFLSRLSKGAKARIEISYSIKHPENYRLKLRNAGHPHYESEGGAE